MGGPLSVISVLERRKCRLIRDPYPETLITPATYNLARDFRRRLPGRLRLSDLARHNHLAGYLFNPVDLHCLHRSGTMILTWPGRLVPAGSSRPATATSGRIDLIGVASCGTRVEENRAVGAIPIPELGTLARAVGSIDKLKVEKHQFSPGERDVTETGENAMDQSKT